MSALHSCQSGSRALTALPPKSYLPPRRTNLRVYSQEQSRKENNQGFARVLRQIQGSLPVIGLISRLASPEGGIGTDELAYPEYCRAVFEAAPEGFQVAVAELQARHGKPAQRKYILLCTWMVQQGLGVLPAKSIVDGARRLRVSNDLEYEMDRFSGPLAEATKKYTYMERPVGRPADVVTVAVDALARLCLGLPDGEPIDAEDGELFVGVVSGALQQYWVNSSTTGTTGELTTLEDQVRRAVSTRTERKDAYI